MPSYTTLAVLALAASTVSPALSAPIQEIREQTLSHRAATAVEGEALVGAAEKAVKPGWGKKLKSFALNTIVGGAAAILGTHIYTAMKSKPESTSTGSTYAPTSSSGSNTVTPAGTPTYVTGPDGTTSYGPSSYGTAPGGSTTYGSSTYGTVPGGSSTYGSSTYGTTTYGTGSGGPAYARAIARRARKKRALDRSLPEDIFTRSNSGDNKLNRRTSSHLGLSSRADLERAIRLFGRMLDELD